MHRPVVSWVRKGRTHDGVVLQDNGDLLRRTSGRASLGLIAVYSFASVTRILLAGPKSEAMAGCNDALSDQVPKALCHREGVVL